MSERLDDGPFFHGTIADVSVGDLLTAGRASNYRPEIVMNHVYFTALRDGAGLSAELAAELAANGAAPRVYRVEPTGEFENDPNVTDKKFPGNPTRSYRSSAPVRVVEEITDWTRLTPEALQFWRERIVNVPAEARGEILNQPLLGGIRPLGGFRIFRLGVTNVLFGHLEQHIRDAETA